jgi:hypothetical protein
LRLGSTNMLERAMMKVMVWRLRHGLFDC